MRRPIIGVWSQMWKARKGESTASIMGSLQGPQCKLIVIGELGNKKIPWYPGPTMLILMTYQCQCPFLVQLITATSSNHRTVSVYSIMQCIHIHMHRLRYTAVLPGHFTFLGKKKRMQNTSLLPKMIRPLIGKKKIRSRFRN